MGRRTAARRAPAEVSAARWRPHPLTPQSWNIHGQRESCTNAAVVYHARDVRPRRTVATWVLGILLATSVVVPGPVGSRTPAGTPTIASDLFRPVAIDAPAPGTVSQHSFDPAHRAAGALEAATDLREPVIEPPPTVERPQIPSPTARLGSIARNIWRLDRNVSWYGPGFYGRRTACGYALTESLRGVAHRTLPCGTLVTFRNPANGRTATVPVVDRGPYVPGRQWDLTGGLCLYLGHCYTGPILWRLP